MDVSESSIVIHNPVLPEPNDRFRVNHCHDHFVFLVVGVPLPVHRMYFLVRYLDQSSLIEQTHFELILVIHHALLLHVGTPSG